MKKISIPFWWIKSLCILYIVVWTISPPLSIGMSYRLLALACAGVFFFMIIAEDYKFERIYIFALLFALAVALIQYIQTKNLSDVLGQINIYMFIICFLINRTYQGRWHQLRIVIPVVLILLLIYNIKTTQVLIQDPTVARLLVRNDESTYQYLLQGVGGYGLIYPQVCIFPAILAWIIKAFRKNLVCFLIGAAWLFSYFSCIMKAGYSIAIFASFAGALVYLAYKGRNVVGVFLVAIALFVGTLLIIIYVAPVRNFLLETFDGTAVTKKIHDLMDTSTTGEAEGSFYVRMVRYMQSLRVAFTYPFIGSLGLESPGGHSAILDVFAKYGLWGGYINAYMIYYVPNHYKKKYESQQLCSISNGTLVNLLFVSILDSISFSFTAMILLVLPLLYEDIIRWEKIET